MSTEVHSNQKEGQRPKYKDYVSFLEAYKNGRREEDGENFSLTDSSNNSSSSVNSLSLGYNSDHSDKSKKSFKEYLESYNSKKYGPVQPGLVIRNGDAKPTNTVSTVTKTFEKTTTTENKFNRVNSVSKMFEKNSATESSATKTVSSKVNQFEFQILNGVDGEAQEEQRKISIVEISKKFENHSQQKMNNIEHKVALKKTNSITEKSKVFEENSTTTNNRREIEVKKNIFNSASKPQKPRTPENLQQKPLANGIPNYPPPPPPPQQQPSKILYRPPSPARSVSPPKEIRVQKREESASNPPNSENAQKIKNKESAYSASNIPPPPPPPQQQPSKILYRPPSPARSVSPQSLQNGKESAHSASNVPPPPPPPMQPLTSKSETTPNPQRIPNGYSTLPRAQTKDKVDGIPTPSLDKNDPRVKKLVYGALRDMYGAYHDRANDYLATLPKNRVRKNNGLDSIINSIAAQGGLDKLSGRANPSVDVE